MTQAIRSYDSRRLIFCRRKKAKENALLTYSSKTFQDTLLTNGKDERLFCDENGLAVRLLQIWLCISLTRSLNSNR